ncbi:hypothetical protein PAMP_002639 [Pampus punctatissimus]
MRVLGSLGGKHLHTDRSWRSLPSMGSLTACGIWYVPVHKSYPCLHALIPPQLKIHCSAYCFEALRSSGSKQQSSGLGIYAGTETVENRLRLEDRGSDDDLETYKSLSRITFHLFVCPQSVLLCCLPYAFTRVSLHMYSLSRLFALNNEPVSCSLVSCFIHPGAERSANLPATTQSGDALREVLQEFWIPGPSLPLTTDTECWERSVLKVAEITSALIRERSSALGVSSFPHLTDLCSSLEFQLLTERRLEREKLRLQIPHQIANEEEENNLQASVMTSGHHTCLVEGYCQSFWVLLPEEEFMRLLAEVGITTGFLVPRHPCCLDTALDLDLRLSPPSHGPSSEPQLPLGHGSPSSSSSSSSFCFNEAPGRFWKALELNAVHPVQTAASSSVPVILDQTPPLPHAHCPVATATANRTG